MTMTGLSARRILDARDRHIGGARLPGSESDDRRHHDRFPADLRRQSTTAPAVMLTSVAVMVLAQSEARNTSTLATSLRVGRRCSIVTAASGSTSSWRS